MPTFTYIPARMILSVTDLQGLSPEEIAIIDSLPPYRVAVWPNRKGVATYPTERGGDFSKNKIY